MLVPGAMIRDTSSMDRPVAHRSRAARLALWGGALVAVLAVLLLLARPAIRRWHASQTSVRADRLRFGTVVRGDLIHDIGVQGRVVAASSPTLYSPRQGLVSLKVREGQLVASGDVLAVVESPELDSQVRQEQATFEALQSDLGRKQLAVRQQNLENRQRVDLLEVKLEAANRALDRSQRLSDLGLANAIELEQARDAVKIASLELDQAKQSLELEREALEFELKDTRLRLGRQRLVLEDAERQRMELSLRAPFDGQVGSLSVADRDAVVRGQPVLTVVDLSDLEVEVSIPESSADNVATGAEAVVTVDGRDWPGRLTRIAAEVKDSQVQGRVAFVGEIPANLRQSQRVSIRLVLDRRHDVLKVPRGPFLEAGGGRTVYVVADGLARRRDVSLGAVSVTEVEVIDGLAEGERIVLSDTGGFAGAETVLIRK